MAVLPDNKRAEVSATLQREVSRRVEQFGALTKADLRAAVNALDDWFNTNASTLNSALPQPARSALTTAQKAELLKILLTFRYQEGV